MGSWNTNTAMRNCSVGDKNCTMPSVLKGSARAARANHTSGSAVTGPESAVSANELLLLPLLLNSVLDSVWER